VSGATAAAAPPRVVIVGAGISGLACAHHLLGLARERGAPIALTLLDGGARPGGVIATERTDGFLLEGGPDCFISDKPWALDLCRRLGMGDQIIGTNPDLRRSFVATRGRVLPIPEGYQLMAPGRLLPFATSPILSPAGRLRAAIDLVLPRGAARDDESLASFVRRRFGREMLEALAQPLAAGIYNADPESLSLRATMPRFLELEQRHRSVILGLWRARRAGGGGAGGRGTSGARYSLFVTLRSGVQALVDRLVSGLPEGALRLGVRVDRLDRSPDGAGGGWRVVPRGGAPIDADAVVLAMPARAAAAIVRDGDDRLAAMLAAIPYGHSMVVNLAYRRQDVPHPLDGFGLVVPRREARTLFACSFSSVKFEGRAPGGMVLLRAFVNSPVADGPAASDAAAAGATAAAAGAPDPARLEREARDDLRRILGITAAPAFARTWVHLESMAQYAVGHLDRVAAIEAALRPHAGLALAGNGLHGSGVPDCVRSGERAAAAVAAHLTDRSRWYPVRASTA
jgi:oxygen-dependent protoporphyrinogen oxidase